MIDLHGTEPHGRSLANGMILVGLFGLLRDKEIITNAEIRDILSTADAALATRANETAARAAREIIEIIGEQFRKPRV